VSVRITILCENSVGPISGTLGEHGFAALIEPSQGAPILFDTGAGATLLPNASRMNKDLRQAWTVVLSHGHYDHTGGLLPLLNSCGPKQVFAHPGIFAARFRVKDSGQSTPIGIPQDRPVLEAAGARFDLSDEFRPIAAGMYLTGEIPRMTAFETGDKGLYRDCAGRVADSTPDDQSLVIETQKGLVVLLGCCHAGLVNTLDHIARMTSRHDIHAIIGGMHLAFCGQEQVEGTLASIRTLGVPKLAAAHCTGFAAAARMLHVLPKAFQLAMVGYTIEF